MYATMSDFERLNDVEKEYERVFGEGSLKRCIEFLYDPVFMLSDEINNAISILQEAIEKKQPLKQMSVEDFEGIIF
ncbi:hypothetical protein [Enterococcus cecorum]|uniref:hypothetical protein n=1 Tax=Enterococcus cecorum TaxID=44008 RepID=UPI003F9001FD